MNTYTGTLCNDPEYVADHLQALDDRIAELEAICALFKPGLDNLAPKE